MPAPVNRHLLKTQGYAAGVHVRPSESDPEAVQIDVFEHPGIQAGPALEKEIEKHASRQEFRRASYADLGELAYPSRAAESYAEDLVRTLDVAAIRARRFRIAVDYMLLVGVHHPAARPRRARRREDRRARLRGRPAARRRRRERVASRRRSASSRLSAPTSGSSWIRRRSGSPSSTTRGERCRSSRSCSSSCPSSPATARPERSRCR